MILRHATTNVLLIDFNTAEDRPLRIERTLISNDVLLPVYNGNTVLYADDQPPKLRFTLHWNSLAESKAVMLENLWKGPPHAPTVIFVPRPDVSAEQFTVKWAGEVSFRCTGQGRVFQQASDAPGEYTGYEDFKSGQIVFEEV